MKQFEFEFSDENLSETDIMIALPSIILGVSVLTLPRQIAEVTLFADGWISILITGIIATTFAVLAAKLASAFPEESFFSYSSSLITKPGALIITMIFIISAIIIESIVVQSLAKITRRYLFNQTPIEVIALIFLLVVVYAVASPRAGIFRLNMLFLPVILFVYFIVIIFNIKWIEVDNFLPLFKTNMSGYAKGILTASSSYIGFGMVLFYIALIKKPKKVIKPVIIGMSLPIVFYLVSFLVTIGIFGNSVTSNLIFPAVEIAKRVDFPGGIFERIDAFFFVIWIMAIFNTAAIFLDIAVLLLQSIFTKLKKITFVLILSPIVFYISMFPQTVDQVDQFTKVSSYLTNGFSIISIIILYSLMKIRGKQHDK